MLRNRTNNPYHNKSKTKLHHHVLATRTIITGKNSRSSSPLFVSYNESTNTPHFSQKRFAKGGKDKGGKSSSVQSSGDTFDPKAFQTKMDFFVDAYTNELSNIKIGRATPEMLHNIQVVDPSTAKKVTLQSLSQIYTKPPASLVVSLNDHTDILEKTVCTAISGAGLDLNPYAELVHGVPSIIVPFPKATAELRSALIKQAKTKNESTKVNIRNQRKLWNDAIKSAKLPKDDAFRAEKDCQNYTDKSCEKVDDLFSKKEKEINAV